LRPARCRLALEAVVSTTARELLALDEFQARRPALGSRSHPAAIAKARTSPSVTTAGRPTQQRAGAPSGAQDCSSAKKQKSPPALLVVVQPITDLGRDQVSA